MGPHIFVDETKERGLVLAAAVLERHRLTAARQLIAGLTLRGQRSIHFCKERNDRRREILLALRDLGPTVLLYDATDHRNQRLAREACLRALITDAAKLDAERLVLEMDESRRMADVRTLNHELRLTGMTGRLRYDHLRAHEDRLLSLPDAVAWSWARGGEWKMMVRPMVREIRPIDH
ncbi:hypothetical protein AB0H28_03140 [Micromonospora sp. NPDC050980]|uniref:hypothetical protein n=1 Tax=Micromonospora sp. NPDC050980 TaxID=3155161 RepID=UPI0033D9B5F8